MTAGRCAARWAFVASVVGALYLIGERRLPPPPLAHPDRILSWWSALGPLVATFSAARLALLVAGGYWLLLMTLVWLGSGARPTWIARLPAAGTVVRWLAGASASGLAVVIPAGVPGAGAGNSVTPSPPPVLVSLAPVAGRPLVVANPRTWLVRPGDNLWSIAEAASVGRHNPDVGTYWLQLIAVNRGRLVQPSDPSLIYPGQLLLLPDPQVPGHHRS